MADSLLAGYELSKEDCDKQISDRDREKICSSCCFPYGRLSTYLNVRVFAQDIKHDGKSEPERRSDLLEAWNQMMGSDATYRTLIVALLEIEHKNDAEVICKLLKTSMSCSTHTLSEPSAHPEKDETVSTETSTNTKKDLKFVLDSNRHDIVTLYASYFRCIQESIERKGISVVKLCSYVMSLEAFEADHDIQCKLLAEIRHELESAESTQKLLDLVAKDCASFMNIGILGRIVKEFGLDSGQDAMKYPEYLVSYINKHKISEFTQINPKLAESTDTSKEISLKVDIAATCKLAKIKDLHAAVAHILHLLPSAIQLVSIQQGCVVVKFRILTHVADMIFTKDKKFSHSEKDILRSLSVLRLECDGRKFEVSEGSEEIIHMMMEDAKSALSETSQPVATETEKSEKVIPCSKQEPDIQPRPSWADMSETGCMCLDNFVDSLEVTPVSDSSESEEKASNSQRPLDSSEKPVGPDGGFDGSTQQGFSSESNHSEEPLVSLTLETSQPVATGTEKSEMVVPCSFFCKQEPKPLHLPETIFKINGTVSKRYDDLMARFSSLMVGIHQAVTKGSTPMDQFTVHLMGLRCNMMLGTVKSPGELKLRDIKDWTEMFDTLSDIKAWDCFNYSLLRKVIDDCLKESEDYAHLKSEIESYDGAVEAFLQSTLLVEFLDVFRELFPDDSSYYQGCGRLKAKLTGDLATMTMAKYRSTKGHLMSQFRLHNCVLRLAVTGSGCVILHWYLPPYLIPHIKQHCKVLQPDFGQAGVIELCIDDYVLYQASNIAEIVLDECIEPASDVMSKYDQLLAESINQPKEFWSRMALKTLLWDKPFTKQGVLKGCDMSKGKICWFDGKLNASVNCLDRHAEATPNKVAIIWEKNDGSSERISYQKLLEMTCQIAHVLKSKEVKKGDVVLIYMPSSPIAVAAMLACTRIGAVHCVVYAVLKNNELEARINDAGARCIITSDVAMIGNKTYELKATVDRALTSLCLRSKSKLGSRCNSSKSLDFLSEMPTPPTQPYFGLQRSVSSGEYSLGDEEESPPFPVKKAKTPFIVLVSTLSRDEGEVPWNAECYFRLEEEMARHATTFDPVSVEAEHTMFIMYTSGTTAGGANPTGIKHCTAGYLLYVALTHQYVFDYKTGDVFGCMADLGWITGHSYVVYGPLCNGATTVLFEGTAMYPSKDRYWRAISQHKINQFYVTPFVISGLMKHSPDPSKYRKEHDLSSLKTIATVGEPLSSHVLKWLLKHVGGNQCKFVDTWWQTELGGIAMVIDHDDPSELPKGNFPAKPFFGVKPVIVDPELRGVNEKMTEPGYLCLQKSLPGMGRGITSICKQTFEQEYFSTWRGGFFTHDLALKVESGGYRVTGRLNNAIRIQGVWLDVASIEDQMNRSDERILKSALVGIHDKTVNTERHEYEGACILLECNSEDPAVKKEVKSKVIRTVTEGNLLPDKTPGGIFPGVIVLFVRDWLYTASGKTLTAIYQDMINWFANFWFHTSLNLPFDKFCKQHLENQGFSTY